MKSMRSFANNPRLDRQEKPKRDSVKKKIPVKREHVRREVKCRTKRTQSVLEPRDIIPTTKSQSKVLGQEKVGTYVTLW